MEFCPDSSCGYQNRPEYCVEGAKDPNGYAADTIEAIESLLYDNDNIKSGQFVASVTNAGHSLQRSFSMSYADSMPYADFDGLAIPLTRSAISLTHQVNRQVQRDAYSVILGWAVEREETISEAFIVKYAIERYRSGLVQAEIERPKFSPEESGCTALTNYDFKQLYRVLGLFAQSQTAERAENLREQFS